MNMQRTFIFAAFAAFAASSQAFTALDWTSAGTSTTSITSTRGYKFDVVESAGITVTHLSFYDNGADGLAESHDVGLWDSQGNLLSSATVQAGTADPLNATGKFRMTAVTPVFLAAGTSYRVGAVFAAGSLDLQAFGFTAITPPEIRYITGSFINNGIGTLTMPTSDLGGGLPGGSFEYQAVPEPATMTLLGLGAVALLRRRKR